MMQEIELTPAPRRDKIITEIPPIQLKPSDIERRDVYKRMLRESLCKFRQLEHDINWQLDNENSTTDILFYSCGETDRIFKVEGFIDRSAYHVFNMVSDYSYTTKSQWFNTMDLLKCVGSSINEQYDIDSHYKIKVVQSSFTFPGLITKPRNLLGLTWSRYNQAKQSYTTLYTSLQGEHEIYKCPEKHVPFHGDYSIWVNHIEEDKCFLSMIVDLRSIGFTTGIILNKLKQILVQHFKLFGTINYEEIYSPWKCEMCTKVNDAPLLECRYCTVARYWKCLNKGCRLAQPFDATTKCIYCSTERDK